ncbi:MAG: low molecular weight phosphotyrosine protein phosphatase [Campylobacterales bacterium]|nr:low molecular weight phosphotyrosine protein phosphatase [Campylobacterales bacterium]
MKSVIFICLGNICRSSLAEGVARAKAQQLNIKIRIDSAGTSRYHNGEAPCPLSIQLAKKHGIDISHQRSQHTSEFDLNSYDKVIALDESNKRDLLAMGVNQVQKLGDFGFEGADVADLYYYPEKAEQVYAMVEKAVEKILTQL